MRTKNTKEKPNRAVPKTEVFGTSRAVPKTEVFGTSGAAQKQAETKMRTKKKRRRSPTLAVRV